MPRKVLITKDTLEEILDKYQGGGSSAGGSGKLYQFDFDATQYDMSGNEHEWDNISGYLGATATLHFSMLIYESNFERFINNIVNIATAMGAQITSDLDTPQDIVSFINNTFNETVAQDGNMAGGLLVLSCIFADKVLVSSTTSGVPYEVIGDAHLFAMKLGLVTSNGIESISMLDFDQQTSEEHYFGINVNNSCTLTEYGTSASGGSVEAEPIVSIKMTNLEMKTTDSDPSDIRDAQIYCTKETWNSLVNLASTLGVTLTYQNLGTLLQGSSAQEQGAFIGILLNDYYNGKVLPIPYLKNADNWCTNLVQAIQSNLQSALGIDIDAVASASWGSGSSAHLFPNILDRVDDGYVTTDTVITVEEIEGASIGSGSGSGTSDVLYKHVITGLTYDDNNEQEPITLSFLSKYGTQFTNDSLATFFTNYSNLQDEHAFINPMAIISVNGDSVPLIVDAFIPTTASVIVIVQTANNGHIDMSCSFANNTTGITDTVTPYVQVNGGSGSGSSVELPNYYEIAVNVSSQNSGSNQELVFNISEENLDIFLSTANQQLSGTGYTLSKDNWSTLIPQLGTANSQLRHALIRGLLSLSNNAIAEDIDGYSNMIYVSSTGTIKIGYDTDDYTEISSSSVTPISNHF